MMAELLEGERQIAHTLKFSNAHEIVIHNDNPHQAA